MDPPAYEAIQSNHGENIDPWNPCAKITTKLSLRDEVYASRLQHVAALVAQLLLHIRTRAQQGLSRTTMLILPSDTTSSTQGRLVGFPETMVPIIIQLEGSHDGSQFWTQQEVIALLREQTLAAVADDLPKPESLVDVPPARPNLEPRSSFWERKQSKSPSVRPAAKSTKPPVTVEVEQDFFSFRAETHYGLFETLRVQALLVTVDIK